MSPDELNRRITDSIDRWLAGLQDGQATMRERDSLLEELATTLEELQATTEELQAQNEELLEAHEAARVHNERFQDLFDASPDAYLVTDHEGVIRLANVRASELLGASPGGLRERPLASHLAPDDRPSFRRRLAAVVRHGADPGGWTLPLQGPDGLSPVTVTVTREEGSRELKWTLRPVPRSMSPIPGRLLGAIVHDLRAPLGIIEAGAETALIREQDLSPEMRRQILQRVLVASRRANRFIDDVIELSQSLAGDPGQVREVDVTAVARTFGGLTDTGHRVDVEVPPGLRVRTNPSHLDHILSNLVGNAVEHTPSSTHVRVAVSRVDGLVVLEVSDDGPGIPPERRADVFEGLRRGDGGLGLGIVSALAAAHGGVAELVPTDVGTTIRVRLPVGVA